MVPAADGASDAAHAYLCPWPAGLGRAAYGERLYDLIFPDAAAGRNRQTVLAHRFLWSAVVNREIVPGARYFESDLAAMVGSSRVPVREAVARLVDAGLLVRAGRGIAVRPFTRQYVTELYDFRAYLESHAARLAASRLQEGQIEEALEGQRRLRRSAADPSGGYAVHTLIADLRLHLLITKAAGNRFLLDALTRIRGQLSLFQVDGTLRERDNRATVDEHLVIMAALRRRDAEAAGEAIADHIRRTRDRILAATSYPDARAGETAGETEGKRQDPT